MVRNFQKKNSKDKKKKAKKLDRINILAGAIYFFGFVLILQLFNLQIINAKFYSVLASDQHEISKKLFPQRGEIFVKSSDREELYPVATNKEYYSVYAQPNLISNPEEVAQKFYEIFEIPEEDQEKLLGRISKEDDPYEPIRNKVPEDVVEKIKEFNFEGIGFKPEVYRFYPDGNIASQVIGFVGIRDEEKVGQYGIEGYFNKELSGVPGFLQTERDVGGRLIPIGEKEFRPAKDGSDLILTIDWAVEFEACKRLKNSVQQYGADSGSVIIMDPNSGAIMAMCNYPDFDLNDYNNVKDIKHFNNSSIFYAYEPGSIFKPITMAIGLDLGEVNPQTTYIDEGELKISKYTIKNSDGKAHGEQTMVDVLDKSLNLGAIFVVDKIGQEDFRKYLYDFGFGKLTNIELDSEVKGNISSLDKKGYIYMATASYGQGITVTPLQMVSAFSAIANGGDLYKPYIVDTVIEPDGKEIQTKPKIIKNVISSKASTLLSGMLVSVVHKGHARKAGVKGYYIAGKTGTAQVSSKGGGYSNRTIHSFVGFGPVDDPKFVMIVKLDHPRNAEFSSDTAAPLFGDIASFVLKYYQVPPDMEQ